MINNGLGEYEIICDGCDEITYCNIEEGWEEMINQIKDEGWKIRRVVGSWEHYCPICAEEEAL